MAALAHAEMQPGEWAGSRREMESAIYVPAGWPDSVYPPGAPDWEKTASAYLFDCCPADFRAYPVLRRHPVVLAAFASEFVESQLRAARDGLADVRARLEDQVDGRVVQAAVDAWQDQVAHLTRVRRSVALIEESLRGKVFIRRL